MPEPSAPSLGLSRRPERASALTSLDWVALGGSAAWLLLCVLFLLTVPSSGSLSAAVTVIAVLAPVGLIWVAASAARTTRSLREDSRRLQAAIDALRQAHIAANQAQTSPQKRDLDRRVDELIRLVRRLESHVGTLTLSQAPAPSESLSPAAKRADLAPTETEAEAETAQPTLALETPAEPPPEPLSSEDFIRALNFPEDEHDRDGFAALRRALRDRQVAPLIRSAQDVLTLLAEDGIYMDDLTPDRARPQVWRQFAEGLRGGAIAALGGVRDRASLALTAGRMRQDPIFRDVAHHFLRRFDQVFSGYEKTATDAEIAALAETRTARAFMLVGRVSGTFD